MSRVIDRLLREQHVPADVRANLTRMPIIAIDNVAEYFYAHGRDEWSLDRDFPNIAPPFDEWWMEFHLPKSVRQYWQGSVGLICYARYLDEYDEVVPVEGGVLSNHPKWEVHFVCILDDAKGRMTAPLWDIHFLVCADGSLLRMGDRAGFSFQELGESQRLGWNNQIADSVGENWQSGLMKALIQPALLALSSSPIACWKSSR